jgi:biopolymer transport protein ExbD
MKKILLILILISGIISCKGQSEKNELSPKADNQTTINKEENVKVYIDKKGAISINGKPKELKDIDSIFKTLKDKNGIVYYSRSEKYDGDIWMGVLDLVSKYELPIAIFTDKNFTKRIRN